MNDRTYTKLFSRIVTSSMWSEIPETRVVWVTMLALSDQYSEVHASVPGLARASNVSLEACQEALSRFMAPDIHSRTKINEGRRISEIDGGWRLLNGEMYRALMSAEERREYKRQKEAERRQRLKNGQCVDTNGQCVDTNGQIQADADADADAEVSNITPQNHSTPKRAEGVAECERIYQEYPRKEGRPSAFKAITKALKGFPADFLIEKTRQFAASRVGEPPQFTPLPATWFNDHRFNDDPANWQRNGHEAPTKSRADLERKIRWHEGEMSGLAVMACKPHHAAIAELRKQIDAL